MKVEERTSQSASSAWTNVVTFGDDWTYDDVRLPDRWWNHIIDRDGHHLWTGEQGYYPYAMLARRLRQIPWHEVLTCVPRCGIKRCVNPAHLLLIKENEPDG